jgi:ABC-type phosphate/phosphonate transport system ATPase subunit
MLFVKKVESTLKQGVYTTLGPRTVIYGPNGAGKSSVLQALELATCGQVSDVEGREQVKQSGALSRLFPPDESIFAEAELSDGTKFRWSMERQKEDGFKRPEHDAPRRVTWPLQELKSVLTGDASTVQAWLEQKVIGDISESDLLHSLPPSTHDNVKKLAKKLRKNDFMALAKEAKSTARSLRTDATKLENTVENMMANIPVPLMSDERAELDKKLANLSESAQKGVPAAQHQIWEEEVRLLTEALKDKQAQLAKVKLPTESDLKAAKTIKTALTLLRTHAKELGLEACWTCGNSKPDFQGHISRLTGLEDKVKTFALALDEQATLQSEVQAFDLKIIDRQEALISIPIQTDTTSERDAIFRQIANDDAARKAWQNANAQRAEVDRMRIQADQLTNASKSLEKAGKDLLERRKAEFENAVNRFLPEGDKFSVDLDSARIGLLRNGQVHSALSGAEWSRVLLALAASQADSKSICILAPEDRAWDPVTLRKVMEALSQSTDVQILLMSTIEPKPMEGWTLVDVS